LVTLAAHYVRSVESAAELRSIGEKTALMRYRDQTGQDWADIIDFFTMHPEARRRGGARVGRDQCRR
jgi:hypothetical protein